MKRSLAVLLIGFVPLTAARADEKDDWTGEWVLPREQKVPFCDVDGKPLGDGKKAVAYATKAFELTGWKDGRTMSHRRPASVAKWEKVEATGSPPLS